mgnify:CR=1 FL=1
MKRLFAIALLFAGLAARAQETPTVTARVEPDSIMIGDRFDYVIDVEKDLVQVVEFPVFDPRDGKIELVEQANKAGTPIISCMGAGNKLNAAAFEVSDIYKTSFCPLARVMRYELRRRGIRKLKVVYSREQAMTPIDDMASSCRQDCICPPGTARKCTQRRQVPGSTAFVPAVAGLIVAGEVVKDLSGVRND